jgi:cellobiose phosphorylase
LQPGYIKGYVPGIRENGVQYTHAALWMAQAFALLGNGEQALEVLDLINPINLTASPENVERFRLEPYVVPADVYSEPPHVGRGGWSWHTGSAAWFYRVVLETLLGFERRGASLRMRPRIPASWPGFEVTYRHGNTTYQIRVVRAQSPSAEPPLNRLDGTPWLEADFPLVDDGRNHEIVVYPAPE